jgi:hypothetical protein
MAKPSARDNQARLPDKSNKPFATMCKPFNHSALSQNETTAHNMTPLRIRPFWTGLALLLACSVSAQDAVKPATLAQIQQSIDWTKLPKPGDASRFTNGLSICSYATKLSFAQAAEFFGKALPPQGWVQDKTPLPGADQSRYLSVAFDKEGIHLAISGYKEEMLGLTRVTLQNTGNLDARKLPKMADAQLKHDLRTNQYFTTPSKPEAVAAFYRQELPALGWREVEEYSAKFHAKEGRTVLRFLQNAMEIGVTAFVNKEGQTEVTMLPHVRYTFDPEHVRSVYCAREIPPAAKLKDYLAVIDLRKLPLMDKAEKLTHDKKMTVHTVGVRYQVPGKVEDAVAFYRRYFSGQGWTELPCENDIDKMAEIKFEKAGYLVSVGASEYDQPGFVTVAVTNHGNVDLRQFPYPAGAEISPQRGEHINLNTTLTPAAAFEFYRQELPKLGWKESKTRGRANSTFQQNDVELRLEIQTDSHQKTAVQLHALLRGME